MESIILRLFLFYVSIHFFSSSLIAKIKNGYKVFTPMDAKIKIVEFGREEILRLYLFLYNLALVLRNC